MINDYLSSPTIKSIGPIDPRSATTISLRASSRAMNPWVLVMMLFICFFREMQMSGRSRRAMTVEVTCNTFLLPMGDGHISWSAADAYLMYRTRSSKTSCGIARLIWEIVTISELKTTEGAINKTARREKRNIGKWSNVKDDRCSCRDTSTHLLYTFFSCFRQVCTLKTRNHSSACHTHIDRIVKRLL